LSIRNRFTGFSQGWKSLTQAQRDAWNAAVGDFARTDIFGDLKNPTGFNLYQRLNNNLSIVGVAAISVPPLPASVGEVVCSSLAVAAGAETMTLTLTGAVPAATAVKVFATAPLSAGREFVKSNYRLIDTLAPAAIAAQDIADAYIAKFGGVGVAGQKVFVKVVPVNNATGQTGQASQVSGIVSA
jgi:hypothetical protein